MTNAKRQGVWIRHATVLPAAPGRQREIHVEVRNDTGSPAVGTLDISPLRGRSAPPATFAFYLPGDRATVILWQPDDPGYAAGQTVVRSDAPLRVLLSADAAGQTHRDEFVINPPAPRSQPHRPKPVYRSVIDPTQLRRRTGRFALAGGAA